MKTIVVYYSLEGNTAWAAEKIAAALGADTLRLQPKKAYPNSGFQKFFWGGKSAVMAEKPALQPYEFRAEDYDCVILGFPVWAGNVTPPIRTFVSENSLRACRVAAFACESGAGAEKAVAKLAECAGIGSLRETLILIDPKAKPSAENERRIADFCAALQR